ncbi:MAG TPA: CidA/LrgA family protein [Atopostipes sp.]|nr:CidA/LrgA family protein [Atopostipes sp.]
MRILKQLFWIFLFSLLGEILSSMLASIVAIPGSVIGMVLLFFALHFNWVKLEQVDEVGTWLTDNMAIFFVPAGVGLMTNFDVLAESWLQLLVIMVVTTAVMMWFVGKVVQKVKGHTPKEESTIPTERRSAQDGHVTR